MKTTGRILLCTAFLLCGVLSSQAQTPSSEDPLATPEGLVTELYKLITFGPGTTPDWEVVRAMFLPEALVVLRTGPEEMTVFSVDGFVQDFVDFIENYDVKKTGFTENILRLHTTAMGDIAQVLVLFESSLPGRPARPVVDSFELIQKDGRWWIVSITNERPGLGRVIPDVLN